MASEIESPPSLLPREPGITGSLFKNDPFKKGTYTVPPLRKPQDRRSPCTACGRRKDWCDRAKPVCYLCAVEGRSYDYPLHSREANGRLERMHKAKAKASEAKELAWTRTCARWAEARCKVASSKAFCEELHSLLTLSQGYEIKPPTPYVSSVLRTLTSVLQVLDHVQGPADFETNHARIFKAQQIVSDTRLTTEGLAAEGSDYAYRTIAALLGEAETALQDIWTEWIILQGPDKLGRSGRSRRSSTKRKR
ncbi:hypothetical protein LTR96_006427 [Exophiala xenobiotica]|nr:hypothetical protein LTR96_006427 [Exophiala xenobiotica]KAK5336913.1 hypothetical protein LTR98_007220 [Exophiala xenobiotica]